MHKKQRLAREYKILRNGQTAGLCNGDKMDIDEAATAADGSNARTGEYTLQPLSDEWFADLDESFNNIDKLLEELQREGPQSLPQDYHHVLAVDQRLLNMQGDLTQCLTALQTRKRNLGKNSLECDVRLPQDEGDVGPDQTLTNKKRDRDEHDESPLSDTFFTQTPTRFRHGCGLQASTEWTAFNTHLRPGDPGESVIKQLLRWWQLCGPGCVRDVRRLGDERMTEVDGLI